MPGAAALLEGISSNPTPSHPSPCSVFPAWHPSSSRVALKPPDSFCHRSGDPNKAVSSQSLSHSAGCPGLICKGFLVPGCCGTPELERVPELVGVLLHCQPGCSTGGTKLSQNKLGLGPSALQFCRNNAALSLFQEPVFAAGP